MDDLDITSYHEAGHAVIALINGGTVSKLTIVKGTSEKGHAYLGVTVVEGAVYLIKNINY